MSIWIYKKDNKGKNSIYLVDISLEVVLVTLGLFAALLVPRYISKPSKIYYDSEILIGIGFILFLIAKIHLIRNGKLVSWGSTNMNKPYRILYKFGYGLMIAGLIIIVLVSV